MCVLFVKLSGLNIASQLFYSFDRPGQVIEEPLTSDLQKSITIATTKDPPK